jgi:DNA-binding PadR family transcriptional regulator
MKSGKPSDARTLMLLGLLQGGPKHGYELHRIVVAHGTLYADFKKPTLYHLLHRLTEQGAVKVHTQAGTRGRRGERLVFELTAGGRELFGDLLRTALSTYEPVQTTFQMAAAYLPWIPAREGQALLHKRRRVIEALRAEVAGDLDHLAAEPDSQRLAARSLAADHALSLLDAELAWLDRAMQHLAKPGGKSRRLQRAVPPIRRKSSVSPIIARRES